MARPLADCGPEELWRGELALELRELEALIGAGRRGRGASSTPSAPPTSGCSCCGRSPASGRGTAEVVVAYLDDAEPVRDGRQVSAYAGLVPRQFQSGRDGPPGPDHAAAGRALLRKVLVEAAWLMLRYNAWAARLVRADQPGAEDAAQAGDGGGGPQAAGAVLGDAAARHGLGRAPGGGRVRPRGTAR